jgi:KDO2-lipid IV(A) lauroyltransferase
MYYVVYGFLWLISLLPLRVLFVISDGIYIFMYYILKYRRGVVMDNLVIAFPGKSQIQRVTIAKKFYRNFIDSFIETIKMLSVSRNYINKRVKANWELFNELKHSGKKIQFHLGHNFNWEWANAAAPLSVDLPFIVVYMPIGSNLFDKLFYRLRSRNGSKLVRATHMGRDFMKYRNQQYVLTLVADQNPGDPASAWWADFFERPAPFVKGPARGALVNDTIVVFGFIRKQKRGQYEMVITLEEDNTAATTEKELTLRFIRYLEGVIREYPEMWLWTHRRWKYTWQPAYNNLWISDQVSTI